ncbi:MAG TPA: glycosyltransferase, partial [Dehalococcoidia bacterium]|nr:glycosyltransferase [Dehalococcoidia bacterium]
MPGVTIVIVVFNTLTVTQGCLTSVLNARGTRSFEVLVVDNGSDPEVLAWLRTVATAEPAVGYIRLPHNVGFARGVNIAARLARGTHLVLLNSDTVVTDGWLDRLADALDSNPTYGLITPVTNYVGEGIQIDPDAENLPLADVASYARR